MENGPVWSDVCAAIPDLLTFYQQNEVEFLCVGSLSLMDIELQIQLAASATVHVMPHGGLSYLAMFAQEGAGVLLLTNNYAKELQVVAQLPWLDVTVVAEQQRALLSQLLHAKIIAVSHSMQLKEPLLSGAGIRHMEERASDSGATAWGSGCSDRDDVTMEIDGRTTLYRLCEV
jgi:hypothetical protein